jgi:hypothetical protein
VTPPETGSYGTPFLAKNAWNSFWSNIFVTLATSSAEPRRKGSPQYPHLTILVRAEGVGPLYGAEQRGQFRGTVGRCNPLTKHRESVALYFLVSKQVAWKTSYSQRTHLVV